MGFDIYGIKPKENTDIPKILKQDWSKLDDKEKSNYWEAKDKWEQKNPGNYFRNNVWWWRPLWAYVCLICEDVMSEEEEMAGTENSALEIPDTTIDRMVEKLVTEMVLENHTEHQQKYEKELKEMPDEECHLCDGTGIRNDKYTKDQDQECNGCKGKGKRRPWACNYSFTAENLEQFVDFLSESGGIKIC